MKRIVIVGGGLAGLVAAHALAKQGCQVTVLESSHRFGGKAGADERGGVMWEHGYHIFPAWYRNLRKIMGELEIPLIDFKAWHYLDVPGVERRWVTSRVPDSLPNLYRSLRDGLLPMPDAVLYWYFVLDMLGEPLSNKAILDQVSRVGMMRDRWYMTDHIPEMERENVLKASAIPVYALSAMTAKKISAFWVKSPLPFLSILPGDLQTVFIDPIVKWAQDAGATLHLKEEVTAIQSAGHRVVGVKTRHADTGAETVHPADVLLLTTPLEVTRKLIGYDLQRVDPSLGDFEHLEAAPMAALTLQLNRRLEDLPREHVFFRSGRYGLSFIDLTQNWPGMTNTMLSFISSNFIPLRDLPENEQYDALMDEIHAYLGVSKADVVDYDLNPNTTTPLFINTIGAWAHRPEVKAKGVQNLYFAGDWVRNPIDLACMEGAVFSAMAAARSIGDHEGITGIPAPVEPEVYPAWVLRMLKYALAPAMIPVSLWARLDPR